MYCTLEFDVKLLDVACLYTYLTFTHSRMYAHTHTHTHKTKATSAYLFKEDLGAFPLCAIRICSSPHPANALQ